MSRARPARFISLGLLGLLAALAGCATIEPPAADRGTTTVAAPFDVIPWPERDAACFDHPLWQTALQQSANRLVITVAEQRGGKLVSSRRSVPITRLSTHPVPQGLVSEFQLRITEPPPEPGRRFAFFSSRTPVVIETDLALDLATTNRSSVPSFAATTTLSFERLWPFHVTSPSPNPAPPNVTVITPVATRIFPADATIVRVWPLPPGVPLRGYAVTLRPIAGRVYTLTTLKRLRDDGWQIIESGLNLGRDFALRQQAPATPPPPLTPLTPLTPPTPATRATPAAIGARLATEVDQSFAELAFALEAVVGRLDAERADQARPPILIVGFSGGALAAPAIAARLEPRVAAAVLVGGGADISRILQTSSLVSSGLSLQPGAPSLNPADAEALGSAYLQSTALDPVKTAPRLAGLPVLMLHAADDRIVPAPTGERLYTLLGRPERWTLDTGHELLFWRLSAYANDIAGWVRTAVPLPPPAPRRLGP